MRRCQKLIKFMEENGDKKLQPESVEDYESLKANRQAIYDFLMRLSETNLPEPIVEIGPMIDDRQSNPTSVFHRFPELFLDSRALFQTKGKKYFSVDIIDHHSIDYRGSIYDINRFFAAGTVGTFIALSVIEHLENIWEIPPLLHGALQDGGRLCLQSPWDLRFHGPRPDCWRISDDGYKTLFGKHFDFIEFKKIENPKRPLSPFALIGILAKKQVL